MSGLLDLAVESHGGLECWNRFKVLRATMSIDGAIFVAKQVAGLQDDVTYELRTHEECVAVERFGAADQRLRFMPNRLTLETVNGALVEARDNPREAFSTHTANSAWDVMHLGYFSSYALWTYLTLPFLYTYPGFVTEEIEPWYENGEKWRRLKATFPETVASHSREQITYFSQDGLMRRHDYTVDVLGGATGANYSTNYREFQGVRLPTARRVYAYDAERRKAPEPLLVSIDIESVFFSLD